MIKKLIITLLLMSGIQIYAMLPAQYNYPFKLYELEKGMGEKEVKAMQKEFSDVIFSCRGQDGLGGCVNTLFKGFVPNF